MLALRQPWCSKSSLPPPSLLSSPTSHSLPCSALPGGVVFGFDYICDDDDECKKGSNGDVKLPEPINRVKRLLHYATLLSPFDDLGLVDSKWVMGCTTRVWLQAKMDEEGKLRFAANNNSKITRGFYSCLVSVLDYALPEEVLWVKTDVLLSLSVGLPGALRKHLILFLIFFFLIFKSEKI
ncbi:hypothetical protein FF1_033181 [Malus domestica]